MTKMKYGHGFPEPEWSTAKDECLAILQAYANLRSTIFYSQLAQQIKAVRFTDGHDSRLWHLLAELSQDEVAAERPMISAIVVHKDNGQPGSGFFELAKELDRFNGRDSLRFWVDEVQKVYKAHA